jgi:hypothetical protein
MVSIAEACGVDAVIYRYISSVTGEDTNIEKWMASHSQKARTCKLVIPATLRAHSALEQFAKQVGRDDFFPVREKGRDLAIEYLACEYGHITGGGTIG